MIYITQSKTIAQDIVNSLFSASSTEPLFINPAIPNSIIKSIYCHENRLLFIEFIDDSELCLAKRGEYVKPLLFNQNNFINN
jgi:hypothetical protein